MVGGDLGDRFQDLRDALAIRARQGHTVHVQEDRNALAWDLIPQAEADNTVPNHGARHENIERLVAAGLAPGGIGGGRNRLDAYFT